MTNDIGWAVAQLKEGKAVQRAGWNGKGMFLFLLPAAENLPTRIIHDENLRKVVEQELGGDTFSALGSVRMFTADKKILTGWLCSQSDLLADDWQSYAPCCQGVPNAPDADLNDELGMRQPDCAGEACDSCS